MISVSNLIVSGRELVKFNPNHNLPHCTLLNHKMVKMIGNHFINFVKFIKSILGYLEHLCDYCEGE